MARGWCFQRMIKFQSTASIVMPGRERLHLPSWLQVEARQRGCMCHDGFKSQFASICFRTGPSKSSLVKNFVSTNDPSVFIFPKFRIASRDDVNAVDESGGFPGFLFFSFFCRHVATPFLPFLFVPGRSAYATDTQQKQ